MEWVSCKEQNLPKKIKLPTHPALSGRSTFRPIEVLLRLSPSLGFQVVFPKG
jgi:hypothetical protein